MNHDLILSLYRINKWDYDPTSSALKFAVGANKDIKDVVRDNVQPCSTDDRQSS